jgi:hypothetical protein
MNKLKKVLATLFLILVLGLLLPGTALAGGNHGNNGKSGDRGKCNGPGNDCNVVVIDGGDGGEVTCKNTATGEKVLFIGINVCPVGFIEIA